ncbi:unnamed protein product [Cochlearia groenlandica]
MAESNQISRKRMRFASSSATEILTRSKSQIQRDRSLRTAPAVKNSPSLTGKIVSKITRTYPRATIKDLRLRRVFSPSSIPSGDWGFKTKGDEYPPRESHDSNKTEGFVQTTPHEAESLSSGSISETAVKKNGTNLCRKSVLLHPCSQAKIFKNHGSFSYKRLLPYLMQAADDRTLAASSKPEKSVGQNPPDIVLSCDKEIAEDPKEEVVVSELMTAKCQLPETTKPISQSADRVFDKYSAGNSYGNTSPLKKVIASSPNKKPVCSRRKLFRTPGSLNYRRMLPYIRRDIQGGNYGAPETANHLNHQEKIEEKNPSLVLVSENNGTQEMVTSSAAKEADTCSDKDKETLPCESVSISPERFDTEKEQETQVKHVIPDTEKNLETPTNALGSASVGSGSSSEFALSVLTNRFVENLSGEEEIMNGSEETEARNIQEQVEANSSDLTAELLDPSVILATPPSVSPSKGILKRSIRGCRGICSCLKCSSFRLNSERAFEFSKNQLQDTEVMVLDLVGEIYRLRDMLEIYDSADHNESYKTQAGEASKRAYEAGELAKSRIQQMNDDLQVHCRIPSEQRARVKFAHYVHEKTILESTKPNNNNNLIHRSP